MDCHPELELHEADNLQVVVIQHKLVKVLDLFALAATTLANSYTNLGVDLLVGEPGKVDNMIVTIPHKRIIEVKDLNNKTVRLPYSPKLATTNCNFTPCKAIKSEIIYPGASITYTLSFL